MSGAPPEFDYDYDELCLCGHPGAEHCLDEDHCFWSLVEAEYGGKCFGSACPCITYHPRSMQTPDDALPKTKR